MGEKEEETEIGSNLIFIRNEVCNVTSYSQISYFMITFYWRHNVEVYVKFTSYFMIKQAVEGR